MLKESSSLVNAVHQNNHSSLASNISGSHFRHRRKASIANNSLHYTQFEHKLLRPYRPRPRIAKKIGEKGTVENLRCAEERDSMRAVLPGKPRAKLQAVCTGCWEGRRLIVRYWCFYWRLEGFNG